MATIGISMVKDEADIIAGTLRHMACEVDQLVVADNCSTDGTTDILRALAKGELRDRLTVVDDPDLAHYQSAKMSALADAHVNPGDWVVPFDADEIWYAEHRISNLLLNCDRPIVRASLINHHATALDEPDPDPFRALVWRQRQPLGLPKVAFRFEPGCVIHEGNHGVTRPSGGDAYGFLHVRHFPARSAEQFTRKALNGAAALARTDLPDDVGQHWRAYGRLAGKMGPEVLAQVFREHWWFLSPADAGLVRDPAPYMRWR